MKLESGAIKRLALYFFYDKYGIVDDYVIYFLKSLQRSCKEIMFVSNGKLRDKSLQKLQSIPSLKVCERENKGFDVWAYKRGFEEIGWDNVVNYDEVVMTNFTVMGPIYPFEEMFDKMNGKDLDFWGITMHNGAEINPYSDEPEKEEKMPVHLQSHFIAVRKKMLADKRFYEYFKNMPMINNYNEAVNKHEIRFTDYFGKQGFEYSSYVESKKYKGITNYPLMFTPIELIEKDRCPIIKRKSFFLDMPSTLSEMKQTPDELINYIKEKTEYNTDFIWQNILRTANLTDIVYSMRLWYQIEEEKIKEKIPTYAIVVIAKKVADIEFINDYLKTRDLDKSRIMVIVKKAVKADASKLLEGCKIYELEDEQYPLGGIIDKIDGYEFICLINMADHSFIDSKIVEDKFNLDVFSALIKSQNHIQGVLNRFVTDKRLGMLIPPQSLNSMYFINLGLEWQTTFNEVKNYLDSNNINVLINKKQNPISVPSKSFWFRTKALGSYLKTMPMDSKSSKPKRFSNYIEPFGNLCPLISQSQGYFTAYALSEELFKEQIRDLYYYLKENNKYLKEKSAKKLSCKCHVYFKSDGVYRESGKEEYKYVYNREGQNEMNVDVLIPSDCDEFRFDIIEHVGCICKGVRLLKGAQSMDVKIDIHGGYRVDDIDIFFDLDPFYIFKGNFKKGDRFTISVPYYTFIMAEKDSIENMQKDIVPIIDGFNNKMQILKGRQGMKRKLIFLCKALFNKI